jgi:hypothetical protein
MLLTFIRRNRGFGAWRPSDAVVLFFKKPISFLWVKGVTFFPYARKENCPARQRAIALFFISYLI